MNSKKLTRCVNGWLINTSRELDIGNCGLTKWPDVLVGKESLIVKFNCSNNQITLLPVLPNLSQLNCSYNRLTSLPSSSKLPNLSKLRCNNNQLTSLFVYPNLTILDCSFNQLTSLPVCHNLVKLYCYSNQLTSLPGLPDLTELYCDSNQLTSLPVYLNLIELYCWDNQLTSLPVYPNLDELRCGFNKLTSNILEEWRKIWRLQSLRKSEIRKRGLDKVLRIMKLRLYLPRLNILEEELVYSPNHPGKFYKSLRLGDWSTNFLSNFNK